MPALTDVDHLITTWLFEYKTPSSTSMTVLQFTSPVLVHELLLFNGYGG